MTSPSLPADASVQVDWAAVIEEVCRDPLGKALVERAQWLTVARSQEEELRYLRSLQPAAPSAGDS